MMNTKLLSGVWLILLTTICLVACNDDGSMPLRIEKKTYEIVLKNANIIQITNGSGHVSVSVANPEIASATYTEAINQAGLLGYISIVGEQKGETTLTVTDDVTKEIVELTIKVSDGYLAFLITESNHPALVNRIWIYLINNEARNCYFFTNSEDESDLGSPAELISQGTYEFSMRTESANSSTEVPHLTLNYATSDDKFTDATIAPTAHIFNLVNSDKETLRILQYYLDNNKEELDEKNLSRTSPIYYHSVNMQELGTKYTTKGITFPSMLIPEGILK